MGKALHIKVPVRPGTSKGAMVGPEAARPRPSGHPRRRSDEQLHSIVEALPRFIFRRVLAPDGTVTYPYVSPRLWKWCGINPAAKGRDEKLLHEYLHPEDRPRFMDAMALSAKELTPIEVEVRLDTAKSRVRWLRTVSYPRKLANGDIRWDGMALDVTKFKTIETHFAYYDSLTGLPNRALFVDWLSHALRQDKRVQTSIFIIA